MALTSKRQKSNVLYLAIAGGNMVQSKVNGENVTKETEGATSRNYKNDDGETITKWELQHSNLEGRIIDLKFKDSNFGERFSIVIQNGDDVAELAMGTDSKYFADFGKKLPNINLDEDVVINPYDLEAENKAGVLKRYTGVSIKQDGEKITNAYWDGKKNVKGFPTVSEEDRKDYDSDDWKMFFIKIKKFLKKKIEATVIPSFETINKVANSEKTPAPIADEEEDDLPF